MAAASRASFPLYPPTCEADVVGVRRFLWRLVPGKGLRIYKWTGKNDYVALCEPEYVSFGGGCVPSPLISAIPRY